MKEPILKINIGDSFGDLTCIDIRRGYRNRAKYLMKCNICGREKEMLSSTIRLEHGITHKACGKYLKTKNKYFYDRWQAMRTRTNNPNYEHYDCYGGRGINSDEFKYFIDFYDAMYDSFKKLAKKIGDKNVSLERIDCDKNYTKDNCIWIDKHDQPKNQRRTVHFKVIFPDGHEETHKNLRGFCREHNLNESCAYDYMDNKLKKYKGYKFIRLK